MNVISPYLTTPPPALPDIGDSTLLLQVFTHKSYHGQPSSSFLDSSNFQDRDYESLEHLGDSVLNMCVTDMIRQAYPDVRPGGATVSPFDYRFVYADTEI